MTLFVRTGSSHVIMVTSVCLAIMYVMEIMIVLMVVMSGTGTVVCDENIIFFFNIKLSHLTQLDY